MARRVLVIAMVTALAATACSSSDDSKKSQATSARTTSSAAPDGRAPAVVFNGEGNNLNAYQHRRRRSRSRTSSRNHDDDPNGLDINAQICFFPDKLAPVHRGRGHQPDRTRPRAGASSTSQATSVGDAQGEAGRASSRRRTRAAADNAENYGCGFLRRRAGADHRRRQPGDGRRRRPADRVVPAVRLAPRCATASSTSASRPPGRSTSTTRTAIYWRRHGPRSATAGVQRYTGPFPTSDDAAGGCGKKDATGAPMADSVSQGALHRSRSPDRHAERHGADRSRRLLRGERLQRRHRRGTTPTASSFAPC